MEFTPFELIIAVLVTITTILSAIALYRSEGDKRTSETLRTFQGDRDTMTTLEAGYQEYVPDGLQVRFADATEFLRMVAKFTVIESDDIAVEILDDIQTPDEAETTS